jgi:cystathionine beta-synthase
VVLHESLLDLVGGTPLVRLRRIADGIAARVYVKLEYLNPGGSVKDRAALWMVRAAEASGALAPGGTVVESTSGNTGMGLAQAAAAAGYKMIAVVPNTIAVEKIDILRAYGAEVVITAAGLPREHPEHVNRLADRIAAETPGGWWANQYDNPANPQAHRDGTGPEIWADTDGAITHLVAGIGTGGTISGTGEHLKRVSGGRVRVIGADPATSRYNGGDGSPFFVEASGHYMHPDTADDVWPQSYHRDAVDRIEVVSDRESILTVRALARLEGMLLGGSSGLVVAAALRAARELGPEHLVVAVLPDSGRSYLSKYHSDTWLRRLGFLDDDRPGLLAAAGLTGPVHTVTPRTSLSEAVALVDDQAGLPVVLAGRDPRFGTASSEILGVLDPADLRAAAERGDTAVPPAAAPFTVGTGETAAEALARVDGAGARTALVLRDGRLAGLVTRDRLAALAADATTAV